MIKKIEKPNIEFKFNIYENDKFYHNDEINEYVCVATNGSKYYFNLEGNFHRIDKPAIEYFDGAKTWIENDIRHRLDGPAYKGNTVFFWIKGNLFSEKNLQKKQTI